MLFGRSQRNGVGNNQLGDIGLSNAGQCRIGQNRVSAACIYFFSTEFLQSACAFGQGACGINHVVYHDAGFAFNVANQVHNLSNAGFRTTFVDDSQRCIQHFSEIAGTAYATKVRRDNNHVFQILGFNVFCHQRAAGHMVKGDVEEALNLCSVQVDGYYTGNTCSFQQVCHQLSSDRLTAACFAVLACIAIVGDNSSDVVSAGAFEGISHNQKLHYVIVNDRAAGRLYNEDILATYTFVNHYLNFAVVETVNYRITNGGSEVSSDFACQIRVCITGKYS